MCNTSLLIDIAVIDVHSHIYTCINYYDGSYAIITVKVMLCVYRSIYNILLCHAYMGNTTML